MLQVLLPLIAPLGVYLLWLWYAQKRAERSGDTPPDFTRGAAFWAILAGFVLMIGSLAWLAVSTGVSPDAGRYESPRLEDGRITEPAYKQEPGS
jgi:hypothetical protein